jgi:hypothetical protein
MDIVFPNTFINFVLDGQATSLIYVLLPWFWYKIFGGQYLLRNFRHIGDN